MIKDDKRHWMHPEIQTSSQTCCGLSLPRSCSAHWQSPAMKTFLAEGQWNASARLGWWETFLRLQAVPCSALCISLRLGPWPGSRSQGHRYLHDPSCHFMPFHGIIPYPPILLEIWTSLKVWTEFRPASTNTIQDM